MNVPAFNPPIIQRVSRYRTGDVFSLVSADDSARFSAADRERIVAVCNEPLIYEMLFAGRLGGRAYGNNDAREFLEWAEAGWLQRNYFVFLIVSPSNGVVGAIDIKSPNLEAAEIGYFASAEHPGLMTNTVIGLCGLALRAGYRSLFALVQPHNQRSAAVLSRSGFMADGEAQRGEKTLLRFTRELG